MNAPQAPLSALDVAREATRLLRENTALLYGLALIAAIPAAFFRPVFLEGKIDASTPGAALTWIGPETLVAGLGLWMLSVVTGASAARAIAGLYGGRTPQLSEAFGDGLAQLLPLVWTSLLALVAVCVGLFLFVIPGAYLALVFVFGVPVVMLEAISGPRALARSRELARGQLGRILGLALLSLLATGVAALPMIAISPEHTWAHSAVQAAGGGLATAWITALFTVLYFDLRRHGEPDFDPTAFAAPLPPA